MSASPIARNLTSTSIRCENLPTVVAGGGLKHGQHVKAGENQLLGDLYITLLQQLGIEADRFSNALHNLNEALL